MGYWYLGKEVGVTESVLDRKKNMRKDTEA